LSLLLKTASVSDGSRMDADRLFHARGPSTAKDWSPNVVLVGLLTIKILGDNPESTKYAHCH